MEEKNVPEIKYNKRMFFGGLSLLLVALLFLFCSFFLAENLSAYFGITFILLAFAGAIIIYSGFFGEKLPGIIISLAVLISGLFLFCFSFSTGKGNTNTNTNIFSPSAQIDLTVHTDTDNSSDSVITTQSEEKVTANSFKPATESENASRNSTVTSSKTNSTSSVKISVVDTSSANATSNTVTSNVIPNSVAPNGKEESDPKVSSVNRPASSVSSSLPETLDITVLSELNFKRNQIATVSAKGKPNTAYSIEVHYSSGKSTAAGLEQKTSDSNGNVSWSFKVGGRTKPGQYKMIISDGTKSAEFTFIVE